MRTPIGLFDSGLGGLSVARELMRRRPNDSLWVVGDTVHVPYGGRPLHEVHGFAMGLAEYLVGCGCRAVVMACNISSAVALEDARRTLPVPVFGMVDAGARAAVTASSDPRYGVMATEGTVRSGAYTCALNALRPNGSVLEVACPRFVPLVESGLWDSPDAYAAAADCAAPLINAGIETVILGCTHYPFLADAIRAAFPYPIRLVDPACAVALEMEHIVDFAPASETPRHIFESTANPAAFADAGSRLLQTPFQARHCAVWDHAETLAEPRVALSC
ncbi:MAG TPA: glutamate racemase [Armatimonadota bacterium]